MKKKAKNKEAVHLRQKVELYDSFLFHYLPQLSALSYITRLHIYDAFGSFGTDRSGSQGSPPIIFEAMRRQRKHQMRKKLPLKPFTFTLLHSPEPHKAYQNAFENLQEKNAASNTCKLDSWAMPFNQGLSRISRQSQQQPASEKHLLIIDPLGLPPFSIPELFRLAEKKVEIILCLPLNDLWQLHSKPEKASPLPEVIELKKILDSFFPEDHPYWGPEGEITDFKNHLKQAFSKEGQLFTALEPADTDSVETALLALSSDAFMMEKILNALQPLRPATSLPPGQQLNMFGTAPVRADKPVATADLSEILKEETDNQQLYLTGLKAGYLPLQLMESLQYLLEEGKLEILDEKKKPISAIPPSCLSFTAYKSAKAVCYFLVKE